MEVIFAFVRRTVCNLAVCIFFNRPRLNDERLCFELPEQASLILDVLRFSHFLNALSALPGPLACARIAIFL